MATKCLPQNLLRPARAVFNFCKLLGNRISKTSILFSTLLERFALSALSKRMRCSIVVLAVMISPYMFGSVSSLRCHVCISYSSWDDCAKSQDPLTCEPGDTHCLRNMVHVDMGFYKTTTFTKTCATSDKCTPEAVRRCKNSSGSQQMGIKNMKCDLECCQGDLCN